MNKCPKCNGRLQHVNFQHSVRNYDALKCLECGNIIDPVILANKTIIAANEYDDTEQQCKGVNNGVQCKQILRGGEEFCLKCLDAGCAGGKPKVRKLVKDKSVAKQCAEIVNDKRCQRRIPKIHDKCTEHREFLPEETIKGEIMPVEESKAVVQAVKQKKLLTYKCFFCGEEHERSNDVGHIKIKDPDGNDRNIFVCHYCSSECLVDLISTEADAIKYAQIIGALMFRRALDSRA